MFIKNFIKSVLNLNSNNYYPSYLMNNNINYIAIFFYEGFCSIKKHGIENYFKDLNDLTIENFMYDTIQISIDHKNKLIYFYQGSFYYEDKFKTDEIENLLNQQNFIELCKIGFLDYIVMTRDNFFQLLLAWDKILDEKPCFVILYQDENDWYDVKSFATQEEMEQFVADHTKN